jgi:hypothetical protein
VTTEPEIPGLPGEQDPATRGALARARRRVLIVVALGVLGLVGFAVPVGVISDANEELRVHGARTAGTVAVLYHGRYDGHADIRFSVDGRDRLGSVDLGSDADYFSEGQRVTVYFDASDPSRMTIDDEDNQPGWSVLPMSIALAVAVMSVVLAPLMEWRRRRTRAVLRSGPWEPVHVSVLQDHKRLLFATPDMAAWRSGASARWPVLDDPSTVPADRPAWWVPAGNRAVFSPDRGRPLVLTRRESTRRRNRIR